jgi:uncharacterized protein (DUF58 family)
VLYKQTVLITGATFIALSGYVMRLEQLYFMAGVLAFLTLGSFALSRASVRGLELHRGPAHKIYEGEACDIAISVTSRSRLPKAFIGVRDTFPAWLQPLGAAQLMIPSMLTRGSLELSYRVLGAKRGAYRLGPIALSSTDPLGVFTTEKQVDAPQELIVYPVPVRVSPERLAGALAFGAESEQLSAAGSGMEFYGIRDYQPGDALRRIHWPSTARLGHLHVIEFEESLGADMVIAVDLRRGTHAGAGRDSTLEIAIKAAASLAAYAVDNGMGAVVVAQDARRSYRVSARRPEELPALLEALARMEGDGETSVAAVMVRANDLVTGMSAVVLTAAPDDELVEAAIGWMRTRAQVVAVVLDAASYGEAAGAPIRSPQPQSYVAAARLRAVDVRVETMRRGDDLERALERAMSDAAA